MTGQRNRYAWWIVAAIGLMGPAAAVLADPPAPGASGGSDTTLTDEQRAAREQAFAARKAYLGVTVTAVDPTLGAQLALPEGVGLVVAYVDPQGPAAKAGIQRHDVLHKLDEQVLVNPAQLRVLVRTFEPGRQVTLHAMRQAKPLTVQATLAGRKPAPASTAVAYTVQAPAGQQGVAAVRSVGFKDSQHHLRLTNDPAGQHLYVTDAQGNVVYDGYVDTEADRAAMPDAIRRKLERVERLLKLKMRVQAGALQRIEGQLATEGGTDEQRQPPGDGEPAPPAAD